MKRFFLCSAVCAMILTGCSGSSTLSSDTSESSAETATAEMTTAQTTVANTTTGSTSLQTSAAAETTEAVHTDSTRQYQSESEKMFSEQLSGVDVAIRKDEIFESGEVDGVQFSLTIDLQKWEKLTTYSQMIELSRLFWQCYPKMYMRFADLTSPPTDVTLAIENEGYEVAAMSGSFVHLHDRWLFENPCDFDCITHELAHVIQAGWDADYLEYSDYIERFADCCRFEYAMDDGYYNDAVWTLQSPETENTREKSVRFLVWLDQFYSDAQTDIIRNYVAVCSSEMYPSYEWNDAWTQIFAGTALAGKSIDEVWEMYLASDFAYLSSEADFGEVSDLLAAYPVRKNVQERRRHSD